MVMGRPKTVSLSSSDMIALGEEMIDWVTKNKPIHLSMWYTMVKDITDKDWDCYRKNEDFFHYYTKALKLVGYGYLDKDSNIDVRLKDRWQRVYFKDLKAEEDQTADENAERQAKAHKNESKATAEYTKQVNDALQRGKKKIK